MKNSRHYPVSFSKVNNPKDGQSFVQNEINEELQKLTINKAKISKTYESSRQYFSNTSE